jgi:phospholipase/carboxylesterase
VSESAVVIDTGSQPTHSVVWLHGLGADGNDFAGVVPELIQKGWPAIRFIFPHAPIRPVTVNGGYRMRAWYDISGSDIAAKQDETGILQSVAAVHQVLDDERARGVPTKQLFLAGFSQGGAITLCAGTRYPYELGGLIALSTYLPLAEKFIQARAPQNAHSPIFMAHGTVDPVVPFAYGERSCRAMQAAGQVVAWHSYPMAHQVCTEEIADIRAWLNSKIRLP